MVFLVFNNVKNLMEYVSGVEVDDDAVYRLIEYLEKLCNAVCSELHNVKDETVTGETIKKVWKKLYEK